MDTRDFMEPEENKKAGAKPVAYVSALSFVSGEDGTFIRIIVNRDLSDPLTSFTVSYRFSGVGSSGDVIASRFFTLTYAREGINQKDVISLRLKVPEEYDAVGCTAFVSKIEHKNLITETFEFGNPDAVSAECALDGIKISGLKLKKGKKLSSALKIGIAVACAALLIGGGTVGGIALSKYAGVKNTVNRLIDEKRYGEAYKIAETCSPTYVKTACGNIISSCLADRDYITAYAYATVSGREQSVYKRVEYEIETSGEKALESDALKILKTIQNDEDYDAVLERCISKLTEEGDYPAAIAAANELRDVSRKILMRHNLIVDGACFYSADTTLKGLAKYDKALEFFHFYASGDDVQDSALALEIYNKAVSNDDAAGAIVLSSYFTELYDTFEVSPSSIKVTADNYSIRQSLEYSYPLLTADQKRCFHEDKLAISEETYVIKNGSIFGTDIKNAVSVATYENRTAVLHSDGTVTHIVNKHNTSSDVPKGINAVQVAVGLGHTVILNADGTVVAVGDNSRGQCNVSEWSDIVEIACGRYFTLGLKADGTLVACGSDKSGQCFIKDVHNVMAIAACDQSSIILFRDGTVLVRGYSSMGLRDVMNNTDVMRIKAGGNTVIAERKDGTFTLADGTYSGSAGDVYDWDSAAVEDFAVGSQCVAYVASSGRVIIKSGDGA